jgi:hypothetical protein
MIIDTEKIIQDTLKVFNKSSEQKKKFNSLKSYVFSEDYCKLHQQFLTPTSIKIDCDLFKKEIQQYSEYFEQWGNQHTHLPRYGLALVNQDGVLKNKDPINRSLYEWNNLYPNDPIIETDCLYPTSVMDLKSLEPLKQLDGHWCRSNILKWNSQAEFKPHIDAVIPTPWVRLWGTTDANNLDIRYDNGNNELVRVEGVESGRIYIIDTTVVHDAFSRGDNVYQFFLSVLPSAINILKEIICRH